VGIAVTREDIDPSPPDVIALIQKRNMEAFIFSEGEKFKPIWQALMESALAYRCAKLIWR
jgi:hypothetical protein